MSCSAPRNFFGTTKKLLIVRHSTLLRSQGLATASKPRCATLRRASCWMCNCWLALSRLFASLAFCSLPRKLTSFCFTSCGLLIYSFPIWVVVDNNYLSYHFIKNLIMTSWSCIY